MVETTPVHQMEVEVVEHVRRVQDLLRRVNNSSRISRPRKVEVYSVLQRLVLLPRGCWFS